MRPSVPPSGDGIWSRNLKRCALGLTRVESSSLWAAGGQDAPAAYARHDAASSAGLRCSSNLAGNVTLEGQELTVVERYLWDAARAGMVCDLSDADRVPGAPVSAGAF